MPTLLAVKGSAKSALGIHGLTASLVVPAGMWLSMGRGDRMIHTVLVWLLTAGFLGAGLFNVVGTRATRDEFVAWGYPAWWCYVTGGLEILTAALIAVPLVRGAGIVLGALVILAAVATLLRHRAYAHLPPAVAFLVGIALVVLTS